MWKIRKFPKTGFFGKKFRQIAQFEVSISFTKYFLCESKITIFSYCTVCKFMNFSTTQILREINFGKIKVPKNYFFDNFSGFENAKIR